MVSFIVEIDCDNAAFEGNMLNEVSRILGVLAECPVNKPLLDINGNKVGTATWKVSTP